MEYSTLIHLFGVFFFGISGALMGVKAKLDLFGVAFIAGVSALGGGTIRDIFIGHYPLSWVNDPRYILAVLAGTMVDIIMRYRLAKIKNFIFVIDSLGIGFFTVSAVRICLSEDLNPFISLVFGILSVILGGLIRDIICNEVPMILRRELVATASLIGGVLFLLFQSIEMPLTVSTILATGSVLAIRVLGLKYKWQLPIMTL